MTRQGKITILGEVGILTDTSSVLLKIVRQLGPGVDSELLMAAVGKIVEACKLINELGAQPLPEETVNPILN